MEGPGLSRDQDHQAPCPLAPIPAHPSTLTAEQKHGLQTAIWSKKPRPQVFSAQLLVPRASCPSRHGLHDPIKPLGTHLGIGVRAPRMGQTRDEGRKMAQEESWQTDRSRDSTRGREGLPHSLCSGAAHPGLSTIPSISRVRCPTPDKFQ